MRKQNTRQEKVRKEKHAFLGTIIEWLERAQGAEKIDFTTNPPKVEQNK